MLQLLPIIVLLGFQFITLSSFFSMIDGIRKFIESIRLYI